MMRPDACPRTLFITPAAFNHTTGGGITFSALFRGWPANRLATAHSDTVPTASDVCRQFYRLGPAEIAHWPRFGTPSPNDGMAPAAPAQSRSSVIRVTKNCIAGNGWPDSGRLSPALEGWIEAFRPELLYTILGTIGMMELVDVVRRRFALPLVVHFMDDWPSHLYRGGLLSFAARARMQALIRRLIDAAAERMTIGEAMVEAFTRRYGVPFTAFQNAIDIAAVDGWIHDGAADRERRHTDGDLHVLYVGSIFDNAQAQSLIDIAQAVAALSTSGHTIRFDLYSPLHLAERFRTLIEIAPCVRLHDTITDDERFFQTTAAADILVLPVNFDPVSVRLIRYSMPTKLPAYLASGTPTLVYGPPGVAQVEDARRHGWGYVLDRRGADGVAATLSSLADDGALRTALVTRARQLAASRHDATTVRNAFQTRLIAAARTDDSAAIRSESMQASSSKATVARSAR